MVTTRTEGTTQQTSDAIHVRFWREFDDFFLYKASPETQNHVFGFIGNSVPVWLRYAFQNASADVWYQHIRTAPVKAAVDYILAHHLRIIDMFYGSDGQDSYFESIWRFGGNLLPDDPDSTGSVRHTMNSTGDWFNWSPFLDAVLRMNSRPDAELMIARGWHFGLVADGILRSDKERPPHDRLKITDFGASDPNVYKAVTARYANASAEALLSEFVRRVREVDVIGPPVA